MSDSFLTEKTAAMLSEAEINSEEYNAHYRCKKGNGLLLKLVLSNPFSRCLSFADCGFQREFGFYAYTLLLKTSVLVNEDAGPYCMEHNKVPLHSRYA